MTRYLYRVVDRSGKLYGVCGPNFEPQFYWDDDNMKPYGIVVPAKHVLEDADKEHSLGAPHRWQRIPVDAWEEMQ